MVTAAGCGGAGSSASSGSSTARPAAGSPSGTSTAAASTAAGPPYIAKAVWRTLPSGRSLQIQPTPAGRAAEGATAERAAWAEVLTLAPDADTAGMRAQFECHWELARLADPDKRSWNLEPWRPVVSGQQLLRTRCNPGGPEV